MKQSFFRDGTFLNALVVAVFLIAGAAVFPHLFLSKLALSTSSASGATGVHRFWSDNYQHHFYTISTEEKDHIIENDDNWSYEGVAYDAYISEISNSEPLFRFYSPIFQGHFFTKSEEEKDFLIENDSNWNYEGIAYYILRKTLDSEPVYRFYSETLQGHFYTTSDAERTRLIESDPNWEYEGIAFYTPKKGITTPTPEVDPDPVVDPEEGVDVNPDPVTDPEVDPDPVVDPEEGVDVNPDPVTDPEVDPDPNEEETSRTITVRARGVVGGENIDLRIGGVVLQSWILTTEFDDYTYILEGELETNYVEVHFVDEAFPEYDAVIDYLQIDEVVYQTEAPTVESNGSWDFGNFCGRGFKQSEELHCWGGWFRYYINETGSVCGDQVVELGEQCDDGNQLNGDGCNIQCIEEADPNVDPEPEPIDQTIPINVHITDASQTEISLAWEVVEGAEGYNVTRDGAYYQTVIGTNSFTDTSVVAEQIYSYRISSFANGEYSPNSDPVLRVRATDGNADLSTPPADNPSLPLELRDLYTPVFYDEFNGSSLDVSKWNTSFLWGPDVIINNEEQYYVDVNDSDQNLGFTPFSFDGSSLIISAEETPSELSSSVGNQNYTSGLITSYDAFKFTHGYAEARVKLPKGQGLWPAFWLLNAYYIDGQKKPEIDIMEHLGHQSTRAYQTYHHFTPTGQLVSVESHVDGPDYSEDYHIFSVEWEPGLIQFYIDGVPHNRIENNTIAAEQMYVLANLAVGGNWPGSPDAQTVFPANYSIDWIRVYQKL